MPVNRLRKFLDENDVKYVTMRHSPAYTAQEVAASAHIPGKELAKTVMVKLDGKLAMAVLPASRAVDFDMLEKASGATEASLAEEDEFRDLFGNCDTGAMPPFGNLYNFPVFSDPHLAEDEEIAFSARSHAEVVRMPYADFERLVQPKVAPFATPTPSDQNP